MNRRHDKTLCGVLLLRCIECSSEKSIEFEQRRALQLQSQLELINFLKSDSEGGTNSVEDRSEGVHLIMDQIGKKRLYFWFLF